MSSAREAIVKDIIKFALDNASIQSYNKNNTIHFGRVTFGKSRSVFRLLHCINGEPTICLEETNGEKLLDDAFKALEIEGLRLFIVVNNVAKPY